MNKRKSRLLLMLFILAGFIGQDMAWADVNQLIRQGDDLYQKRENLVNAYNSLEKYQAAINENPDSYEALWKVAKVAFYIAEMESQNDKRWPIIEQGIACAKKASKLKPNAVEGHFWLGVCYTKVGEIKGILKALFLVTPIKQEMSWVISRNSQYEGGSAYTVLARVYSQVPPLIGGDDKKACKFYEKAHSICPTNSLNLLFMAENYWDLGEKKLAVQILKKLLSMTPDPRWVPETKKNQKAAAVLIQKYKDYKGK